MILLELNDDMTRLPKEVFMHLNEIYGRADKSCVVIKEYGYSQASSNNFLGAFGGEWKIEGEGNLIELRFGDSGGRR